MKDFFQEALTDEELQYVCGGIPQPGIGISGSTTSTVGDGSGHNYSITSFSGSADGSYTNAGIGLGSNAGYINGIYGSTGYGNLWHW